MPRSLVGLDVLESMEAQLMDVLERKAYREAMPTINKFKNMRRPPTLRSYISRLCKIYESMTGSKFVPTEITAETNIGGVKNEREDAYAREMLRELYSSMTPNKLPKNRIAYEFGIEKVAGCISETSFYFVLSGTNPFNPVIK